MNRFLKNLLIYVLLIVGYLFIYVIDIESHFYPKNEDAVESKVDFVYQQF